MKKILFIITLICIIFTSIAVNADVQENINLKKIECTKSFNYQKFVLKINDDEYKIVKSTDFKSVWFEGTEKLTVNENGEVKIMLKRLVDGFWKNDVKIVKLTSGDNNINFKYGNCFSLDITINLETTTTTPPTTTTTPTPTIETSQEPTTTTPTTIPTTDIVTTNTVTPVTTIQPSNNITELPKTGEVNKNGIYLIGICLVLSGIAGVIGYKTHRSS